MQKNNIIIELSVKLMMLISQILPSHIGLRLCTSMLSENATLWPSQLLITDKNEKFENVQNYLCIKFD